MIDLFQVKLNNEYDFIQDTLPTTDGSWLCSLTAGLYTRGHSYQVTGGVATRIEEVEDFKILDAIYPTLENACNYLNNYFYVRRATQDTYSYSYRFDKDYRPIQAQSDDINMYESDSAYYTFNATAKTVDGVKEDVFQVGDYVRITYALRNNLIANVTAKTTTQLTLDNEELKTTQENASIFLMDIPRAVEQIIAQMINFDVFEREVSDLDSESVGNYSYTRSKDFMSIGGLDYPSSIAVSLDKYKLVRLV